MHANLGILKKRASKHTYNAVNKLFKRLGTHILVTDSLEQSDIRTLKHTFIQPGLFSCEGTLHDYESHHGSIPSFLWHIARRVTCPSLPHPHLL